MTDAITSEISQWAVQCVMRDGTLHTGHPLTERQEAKESGERLERINGADWWLVTRRLLVVVHTSPWVDDPEAMVTHA